MRKTKVPAQASETFRVIKIGCRQRDLIRSARDLRELTNKEFIRLSVEQELAGLLDELAAIGIEPLVDAGPCRLPFDDSVLSALKTASEQVHIPAVALLRICLARYAGKVTTERPRRGRRPAKKGGKS
jgi:hypothetical protein